MTQPTTHIEFYRRTDVPQPTERRLGAIRAELSTLAADRGWTIGYTRWPSHLDLEGDPESAVEHVYEAFQNWAQRRGVSLAPAFDRRYCFSWETDERYEALITPVACLSITVDGDLVAVYPHRDGGRTYTIQDGIERLHVGTIEEPLSEGRVLDEAAEVTP